MYGQVGLRWLQGKISRQTWEGARVLDWALTVLDDDHGAKKVPDTFSMPHRAGSCLPIP